MKRIPLISLLLLSACSTPVDPRLATLGDLLINYGERRKVITTEEATLLREAGLIVLTPTPVTTVSK